MHLDHISYSVTDYKRSAAFYASLMGWEVANDNGTSQATLKIGDVGEIIIRNARRPDGAPAPAAPGQPSARSPALSTTSPTASRRGTPTA